MHELLGRDTTDLVQYYKPRKLRTEEQTAIEQKIAEAKARTDEELEQDAAAGTDAEPQHTTEITSYPVLSEGVESDQVNNSAENTGEQTSKDAATENANVQVEDSEIASHHDNSASSIERETVDDGGGGLVKGDEDDVMY